jgi:hypothetical protein
MSSIDQLKSLASSKLGFARTNQFLVELPTTFGGTGGFLGQLTTLAYQWCRFRFWWW